MLSSIVKLNYIDLINNAEEIKIMNKKNYKLLLLALLVMLIFFFYFGSGPIINGGMSGMMNRNGWINASFWRWFLALFTLVFAVMIGLLLLKKKDKRN
jgi:membrane protein CcdC involved in cytochrome C biogenesis